MLLSLLLLLSLLPACTPSVLSEDDQAAIYAAVVRQLYTVDHTFGDNPPNWPVIYLLRDTDDTAGDPRATETNSSRLQESVREAIIAAMDDLPVEFIWVDDRREVIDESIMAVKDNGALITLGNTYLQEDGTIQVAASIYFASTGAGGTTYIIDRVEGMWKITGDTGVRWIS
jgi:hypothetical protein